MPEVSGLWTFLWYGGIAAALLVVLMAVVTGRLIPKLHHDWALTVLSTDRDEWRSYAEELRQTVDRLAAACGRKR